jgi:hypothetical protein
MGFIIWDMDTWDINYYNGTIHYNNWLVVWNIFIFPNSWDDDPI